MFQEQTPCEKIGLKVGDRVEIIGKETSEGEEGIGKIVRLHRDDGTEMPFFADGNDINIVCPLNSIRPLKQTEDERRGAKFGVGATVKEDGRKGVFWKESYFYGKGNWVIFFEDGSNLHAEPHEIRLDHEPEFREIPWNEATHEQRMAEGAVTDPMGRAVTEVVLMKNGHYAFSVDGHDGVYTFAEACTVRVPA